MDRPANVMRIIWCQLDKQSRSLSTENQLWLIFDDQFLQESTNRVAVTPTHRRAKTQRFSDQRQRRH
jgi:hypothetical protein